MKKKNTGKKNNGKKNISQSAAAAKKTAADNKKAAEAAADKAYKKRHSVYQRVCIILFLSAIFFTGLCMVFLKRPEFSEIEKRKLTEKPKLTLQSYLDGSFADNFSKYFSDTVPMRESLVELAATMNELKGISAPKFYGNVNVVADDDGNTVEETDTKPVQTISPDETEPAVTEAPSEADEPVITSAPVSEEAVTETVTSAEEDDEPVDNIGEFNNNGIIVDSVKMYGDNAGVMLFGGSKSMGTRYADIISKYKEAMGEDVNVYNIVVPTSVEFYLPKKFQKYSSSEKDAIDHIYESYTADVIPVDAYSEIAAHTDEYIYLRTDHHWSHRGAYYAYAALCKAMGQTPPDIDKDYEVREIDGYVGSLYGYTNDPILKNSPELFTYYKPKSEYKTYYYAYDTLAPKGEGSLFYDGVGSSYAYGVFLGADAIHTKIVTELETGRKACVFKESYGNAFVPYLVDSFDEIYVIDIRYFGMNAVEYMKQQGITDVIFINNAFAANTGSLIQGIENLYTYPYGTLTADEIPAVQEYRSTAVTEAVTTVQEQTEEITSAETSVTDTPESGNSE